jgi:hypothetical protein
MELPEELLYTILGLLDERMLCAARLVCRRFRQVGVSHFKALHVDSTTLEQHPTTDFTRFAEVPHFAVSSANETLLHLLGHPRVAPIITHVEVKAFVSPEAQVVEGLAHLMPLPKLRSLSLPAVEGDLCNMLLLPLGLEELTMQCYPRCDPTRVFRGMRDASPLTRYTKLSNLAIDMDLMGGSSVGNLRRLSSLRSLELRSCGSVLEVMSVLTMLTSLTWVPGLSYGNHGAVFHVLAHLSNLSRLRVGCIGKLVRNGDLASIAHLTGLTCLDMGCCRLHGVLPGSTVLTPLTCLVSLTLCCDRVGMSILSTLNVEALQSLRVLRVEGNISVLQRATRLTLLEFRSSQCYLDDSGVQRGRIENKEIFAPTLAMMTGLRSLSLSLETYGYGALAKFQLSPVLAVLTKLTELEYNGSYQRRSDLPAIASLPGLSKLELSLCISFSVSDLPTLRSMSGLTRLTLRNTYPQPKSLTRRVRAALDAECGHRGWPPLKLESV